MTWRSTWAPLRLVWIGGLLTLCALWAGPALAGPSELVRFQHAGLARQQVNVLLQDRQGFLWAGTTDGLYRYDGRELEPFQQGFGERSISANDVRALAEDADGNLWIGTTGGGLNRLDVKKGIFTAYHHADGDPTSLASDAVADLLVDLVGHLWIGTSEGLDLYDPKNDTFIHHRHDDERPSSLASDDVTALELDAGGGLWIGTRGGLDWFDPVNGRFIHYRHDPQRPASLASNQVHALRLDSRRRLWIGTDRGLDRLTPATGLFVHAHEDLANTEGAAALNGQVLGLHEDRRGALWVGTTRGLVLIDPEGTSAALFRHSPGDALSLSHDRVYTLTEDGAGIVWIGTRSGIDKWNPMTQVFLHYRPDFVRPRGLVDGRVRAILEDARGRLWVGTPEALHRIDRAGRAWEEYRHDPDDPASLTEGQLNVSLEDSRGRLWFGTNGGLNRWVPDGSNGHFVRYLHDPDDPTTLGAADVIALHEDGAGRLWVGTWGGGLSLLTPGRDGFERLDTTSAGLADDVILDISEDEDGVLWLGYDTAGLGRYDPAAGTATSYPLKPSETNSPGASRIVSIHGREGVLWLGTWGGGLDRFDPRSERFQHFRDGIASTSIFGIVEDDDGKLWLSTTNGLSRFDPENGTFRNFDRTDGLQENEFGFFAYGRSRSGELFFGGWNGLNVFRPEDVEINQHVPPVVVTSMRVMQGERSLAWSSPSLEPLELSHRDTVVSFDVAALDFAAPSKNRYQYQLDGLGSDWIDNGTRNRITLMHLGPGNHTLRVRGSNNHGVWSTEPLEVRLHVRPPFWRTWWFQVLWILALAASVFGYFQFRVSRVRQRNRVLAMEIVRRQGVEMDREKLISELRHKNDELEMFSYTISHEVRNPLFTLQGFLGLLEQDANAGDHERMRRDLEQIRGAADTIQRLLDELLELWRFGREASELENIPVRELVDEAIVLESHRLDERGVELEVSDDLPFVLGDRHRLVEVFRVLLDNASKFTGTAEKIRVRIGLRLDGDEPVVYVADNGMGIPPRYHKTVFKLFEQLDPTRDGTGMGLALARRVVELHGGRIWVESDGPDRGSTFCFTLPVVIDFDEIGSLLEPSGER